MTTLASARQVYALDRLAGLAFRNDGVWCYFRAECGLVFDYPLDPRNPYALIDPETDEFIGIRLTGHFIGTVEPPNCRVFLLRPLLDDLER